MTRRCDRCGASVVDAVGSRQASLFDVPEADPRATTEALAELRAGRILCQACQRSGELFPMQADYTGPRSAHYGDPLYPSPGAATFRAWGPDRTLAWVTARRDEDLRRKALDEAETALRVEAVRDLDDYAGDRDLLGHWICE